MPKPKFVTELGLKITTTSDGQVLVEVIDPDMNSLAPIYYTPELALELASLLMKNAGRARTIEMSLNNEAKN